MTARLNVGCGSVQPDGWVNADNSSIALDAVRADLTEQLPWGDETFDYIVANHVLSDLDHHQLPGALAELRRVLKHDGVLRVLVPDIEGAMRALAEGEWAHFPQGPDLDNLHERFCTFVTWFGTVRSVFTDPYLDLLLHRAKFRTVVRADHHLTLLCEDEAICDLDDREHHSMVLEALR